MLLWKLLTPNLSQVAISSRRTHDGQIFFGPKYYDSVSADKIVKKLYTKKKFKKLLEKKLSLKILRNK